MSTPGSAPPPPLPKSMVPSGSLHKLFYPGSGCKCHTNQCCCCMKLDFYSEERLCRAAYKTLFCSILKQWTVTQCIICSCNISCWYPILYTALGNLGSKLEKLILQLHLAVFFMCTWLLIMIIIFPTAPEGSRKGGDFLSSGHYPLWEELCQ